MEWNVYYHDFNRDEIATYNIFDHGSFLEYSKIAAKKYKTKDEFIEQIRRELFYYFRFKAEWEIIITSWVGGNRDKNAVKIDVYSQVMNNWKIFSEYIWDNRKELLKDE